MIKPVMDRIFVRVKPVDKTSGGIFLTETQTPTRGIVEAVGPGVTCVKKGDDILFQQWEELPSYEKDIVVIREKSLLGIF